MRESVKFSIRNSSKLKKQLLEFYKNELQLCLLNSNSYKDKYGKYDFILAVAANNSLTMNLNSENPKSAFSELRDFYEGVNDWIFGHFSYDLKNSVEDLSSENIDNIDAPELFFFQPTIVFFLQNDVLEISYLTEQYSSNQIQVIFQRIQDVKTEKSSETKTKLFIHSRIDKEEYVSIIKKIKNHIQLGDIYEMNFCQEFYAQNSDINPMEIYWNLINISPTPFSCYYKIDDVHLMSASPERFIQKTGNIVISQPIKGTIKRGKTREEDKQLKQKLQNSEKDRSENVMIVDLVRNDLSRTAAKGSVKVEELFAVYTFEQVFQMISTISSQLKENMRPIEVIENAFPMGSMTGAPKISSMKLIETLETTKRGIYSGSVGYISPQGDFDFNVIIRSILYNQTNQYLSYMVGGAITIDSDPESEYEECMVKAKAINEVLSK